MRCTAMCRETVERPEDAPGWEYLPMLTGSGWFCPGCSEARKAHANPGAMVSNAISRILLSSTQHDTSSKETK